MENLFTLLAIALLCRPAEAVDASCSGDVMKLTASTNSQILISPNYPDGYYNNELCRWIMQAEQTYEVVKFRFLDYDLEFMANCAADYVDTRDGEHLWSPAIKKFCGTQSYPTKTFSTTSTALLLELKTDRKDRGAGFRLEYWTRPRGVTEFTDAEFKLVHKILYGVFALIWLLFGVTMAGMAVIRNNPRLYAKYVMKQTQGLKLPVIQGNSQRPSIASVNAEKEIQKRRLSVAGLHVKKHRNGSVASLAVPVV
ncbi:hypothetical protein CAPTEDRAFT_207189 [Capitella teleta]|uniref:CUB domain-containing protein n=1 Tax=Capitella teleta TaxID=283909 RepID=R7T6Z1_CAPTE|nr:hypothetical protein CAPTEDRAFT_207189 [Capitella teleta]|eukprot:ELT89315.1 hypothetical protein CAPTEDRAFT_207189 [Capitella teleta]